MSVLSTVQAARLLGVTPDVLREWDQRFGFPTSSQAANGRREFNLADVNALHDALEAGHHPAAAILQAQAFIASRPRLASP